MKKSFLVVALRCISMKGLTSIAEGVKFLFLDDVIVYSELSKRYRWLMLTKAHQAMLTIKNSQPLSAIHMDLERMTRSYPELEWYDLRRGDPFLYLIGKRGLSAVEISKQNVQAKAMVKVSELEEIVSAVMEYNFYYRHQETFPAEFKTIEGKMKVLSKRDRWPGRGSWNAFRPQEEKPKIEFNLDFLSLYGPPSETKEDEKPNEDGRDSSEPKPAGEAHDDNTEGVKGI